VSQLFFDSLALSAWKQAGAASWSLRVNPSSGNLHPTEGYLVCAPVVGLCDEPMVAHYTPQEHALERRTRFPEDLWRALVADLPAHTLLVGLTSIHWREAWKYGERAFRYCQHDVGHALAAIAVAAAGLGWQATLLDELGTQQLTALLGVGDPQGAEAEHPDCLLAIHPQGTTCPTLRLPGEPLKTFSTLEWQGWPNQLSPRHVDWSIIDEVAAASAKPVASGVYGTFEFEYEPPGLAALDELSPRSRFALRRIIRQRRSAVAMDGQTRISRGAFYRLLCKTLAGVGRIPFNALPWNPKVHLLLFVHRVEGLALGLYLLVRDPEQIESLRSALRKDFAWEKPEGCPAGLGLYLLLSGDVRELARGLSCHQEIASDGCFSVGMLADFGRSLEAFGSWFYPRLYWECGMIGQMLYLEAEAAGIRGTGIGCFFDDPVHTLLGLEGMSHQSLYHFTVGGPVDDPRLTTLPGYPGGE
jgi:SagB-type dehydrogenase family enzyme